MKCPNCGNEVNNQNNKFCTYCGTKLDNPEQTVVQEQVQPNTQINQTNSNNNQNMNNNIPAVLEVIKFIYENIIYAELNTKSDYCQSCGYTGEIQIVTDEETGKLIWECPQCYNRNQETMNVARRTCGYIGLTD